MHKRRIIDAFISNEITKVLLIDDAYDPPVLDSDAAAQLSDYLENDNGHIRWIDHGIDEDVLCAATNAASAGEPDSDALMKVYHTLYAEFVRTEEKRFDLGEHFDKYKGSALNDLRPLCALLRKCGDGITVHTAGLEDGMKLYFEFRPQILFLDYYLESDVSSGGDVDRDISGARQASLDLLRDVVAGTDENNIPAIVLMSSRKIDDVYQYRHEVKGKQIMSLRFQYMNKTWIRQDDDAEIIVDHLATDVLLDISQGYIFGRLLQQALTQWKEGAEQTLDDFIRQIGNLDMKDFAYLLRFRLREEEQVLSEYLGWLFGEYLKGMIDRNVNWSHSSFSELNNDTNIERKIEGAFDGPTSRIAEFFHGIRITEHQIKRYQLGDLYASPSGNDIRAVITPDCDLVVRKGRTKIKRVLTMGGTLHTFDQEDSAADDLIFREDIPYSIRWNHKDLETFPIEGEEALRENNFQFLGTMRPLYAQEMQRRVLTDLSRIGLPVTPTFGIYGTATVWIRTKNTPSFKPIPIESSRLATIIPSQRGQTVRHRILLRRRFVNELIDQLELIDRQDMKKQDIQFLDDMLQRIDKIYDQFLREGGLAQAKGIFGTSFAFGDEPNANSGASWLQIVIKISEKEIEDIKVIDPLVPLSNQPSR